LDPIALEIVWQRLVAMIDEASSSLRRSSFSLVVRESHDFVVVLLDKDGNALAQSSKSIPPFIVAASYAVQECLRVIPPAELHPGDVIISNDPWISTGHSFDVLVMNPIFSERRIVGYAASIAHWTDIGGHPWAPEAADHLEEGLVIPICRIIDQGEPVKVVYDFIQQNVRYRDHVIGDLNAQLAANDMVTSKTLALLREHDMPDLEAISAEILGRSEQAMRTAIAALPDGTYHHCLQAEAFDEALTFDVHLTVHGDSIDVDFTGTSKQTKYAINSVLNYTAGYTFFALKAVLNPETPNNIAATWPVRVTAPSGSIVNPVPPASFASRHVVGHLCAEAVLGAIAQVVPERVPAGSATTWLFDIRVKAEPGKKGRGLVMLLGAGLGAAAGRDGRSCVCWTSSTMNIPIEILESEYPLQFDYKEFRTGSGGAGKWQGGMGQMVQLRAISDMTFTAFTTRQRFPALGSAGGQPGKMGLMVHNQTPLSPARQIQWRAGEVLIFLLPGGGGYGEPRERPEDLRQWDALNGFDLVNDRENRANSTGG